MWWTRLSRLSAGCCGLCRSIISRLGGVESIVAEGWMREDGAAWRSYQVQQEVTRASLIDVNLEVRIQTLCESVRK